MAILSFEFFFRLLWGWNFYLLFISRAESSEGFLKVSARFSVGYALAALLSGFFAHLGWIEMAPVFLLLFASLAYLSRGFLILRLLSVGIILFSPLLLLKTRAPLFALNMVLSSLTLGGAFVAQFLGHWYLNVPNIHIREFKRISNMNFSALALRICVLLFFCFFWKDMNQASSELNSGEFFSIRGDTWNGFGPFGVILFASRVLWGLVAPLLLTWMAKKTVDMRSTQSATGIFYANSVLMLLGELCALFLEKELLWPM